MVDASSEPSEGRSIQAIVRQVLDFRQILERVSWYATCVSLSTMSKTSCFGWILVAMLTAGCAASTDDETDSASGAQSAAPAPVTSINGKELTYTFFPLPFEEPMLAFAGLSAQRTDQVAITSTSFRLAAGEYTLSAVAAPSTLDSVPVEVPNKVVTRGVPRFMVFDENQKPISTSDGITLFEHVKIAGNSMTYETTLASGKSARGQLQLPGLGDSSKQYAFTVVPRDVPAGSIFGTHFFKVAVACKVAGCASPPPGLFDK